MPFPEVCATCELRNRSLSAGEARLVGHITLEGQHIQDNYKRKSDLKRIVSVALDHFGSSPEVRSGAVACADAHIDGSCEFINKANVNEEV
jgi:hypothetical protein